MSIAITLSDLTPYSAEALIWLSVAARQPPATPGAYPVNTEGIAGALDYLLSVLLDAQQWEAAAEYDDIAGLQDRLRRTLAAIERGLAPEGPHQIR